jgi:protein gp37
MPSIIESEGSELGNSHWAPAFPAGESGIGNRQMQANYLDERRMATLAAADSAKLE